MAILENPNSIFEDFDPIKGCYVEITSSNLKDNIQHYIENGSLYNERILKIIQPKGSIIFESNSDNSKVLFNDTIDHSKE